MNLQIKISEFITRGRQAIYKITSELIDNSDIIYMNDKEFIDKMKLIEDFINFMNVLNSKWQILTHKDIELGIDYWSNRLDLKQVPVFNYNPLEEFEIPAQIIGGTKEMIELPKVGDGYLKKTNDGVIIWEEAETSLDLGNIDND